MSFEGLEQTTVRVRAEQHGKAEAEQTHRVRSQHRVGGRGARPLGLMWIRTPEGLSPPPPLSCFPFLKSKHDSGLANWDTMSAWASGSLRLGGSRTRRQLSRAPVGLAGSCLWAQPLLPGEEARGSSDCCQATEVFRVRQPCLSFHKVYKQFINKAYLRKI